MYGVSSETYTIPWNPMSLYSQMLHDALTLE